MLGRAAKGLPNEIGIVISRKPMVSVSLGMTVIFTETIILKEKFLILRNFPMFTKFLPFFLKILNFFPIFHRSLSKIMKNTDYAFVEALGGSMKLSNFSHTV